MERSVASCFLLVLLLMGCRSSGVPMAPQKSPHFDAVSARLQLGGTVYAYADIEGDAKRAADFFLPLLRDVPGFLVERDAHRLTATALVRILGIDQVLAIGLSSYRAETLYRNTGFIHHTGAREGLLKLFGAEPSAFGMVTMAPRETDLVWEQQLDIPALVDIVRELGALGIGLSPGELDQALSEPALDLDLTWKAVFERLNTTAGLIIAVDESRPLRIPGESFWFPYTDFVLRIDGLEEVADAIAHKAANDPFVASNSTKDWIIMSPAIELPPPWNAYQPSVIEEIATGRMFVVSSPAFLQKCLSAGENVTTTPDFARAFEGLPRTGNGLMYVSPRMTRQMHAMLDRIILANGSSLTTSVVRFFLPDVGYPAGWVVKNTDDGLLLTSNTASSHKSTLLTLGFGALLPAVVLAGVSALGPPAEVSGPPIP
ncbi:MAG: hypothetical protein WAU39_15215 [Polyangiales bacterium]